MNEGLNTAALEAARKAVEDVLIEFRDRRISVIGGNGFVVRETDGAESSVMRLTTADGLRIGIEAYLQAAAVGPQPAEREEALLQAARAYRDQVLPNYGDDDECGATVELDAALARYDTAQPDGRGGR